MSALTRDKVRGMFLGVAIGDALGMPNNTQLTLLVADSLIECKKLNIR